MMMNETNVTTSYSNGTIIHMDAVATKAFLTNIATTIIVQSHAMRFEKSFNSIHSTIDLPAYDNLIDQYCDGVHGAVLFNMVEQNAKILYRFVQDCVTNKSVAGLYLLRRQSANDEPAYKLITMALDEFMDMLKRYYEAFGEEDFNPNIKYNEYNEQFERMMEG